MPKKKESYFPGYTYGEIEIVGRSDRRYCSWVCRCRKCGYEFVGMSEHIKKGFSGCGKCRERKRKEEKSENLRKLVGRVYGSLKISEIVGTLRRYGGKKQTFVKCECLLCGGVSEMPLNRLKQGGASKCAACSIATLEQGREAGLDFYADGTLISAIDGRRKKNRNSSTGYTGVSVHKSGKYRAYICFRRKQYHLGIFDSIEDAIAARKQAEKEIYGDFLDWFRKKHPEQWEKIKGKT